MTCHCWPVYGLSDPVLANIGTASMVLSLLTCLRSKWPCLCSPPFGLSASCRCTPVYGLNSPVVAHLSFHPLPNSLKDPTVAHLPTASISMSFLKYLCIFFTCIRPQWSCHWSPPYNLNSPLIAHLPTASIASHCSPAYGLNGSGLSSSDEPNFLSVCSSCLHSFSPEIIVDDSSSFLIVPERFLQII
jgi:hypothetical protein